MSSSDSGDDSDSQAELSDPVMTSSEEEEEEGNSAGNSVRGGRRAEVDEEGDEVAVIEAYDEGEFVDAKARKAEAHAARKSAFEQHLDDISSDDEAIGEHNTIGNVPLEWYHGHDHIGYNIDGEKIARKPQLSGVDALIAARDDPAYKWTVHDNKTGEDYTLTKRELDLIRRLRQGRSAHAEHESYAPYVDYYTSRKIHTSLRAIDPPKSNFVPDKYEERKLRKLRKLIAAGKITFEKKSKKAEPYLMWGDDGDVTVAGKKRGKAPAHIAAPKMSLPGHEESYNPPAEYLGKKKLPKDGDDDDSDDEEEDEEAEVPKEERKLHLKVRKYKSLRLVPAYRNIVKDRFERCLDLYLCPRVRRSRINVTSESLVPQLPDTSELRPFPNEKSQDFLGHTERVRSIDVSPDGQWVVSGSEDKTVRVWEVATGRCVRTWNVGSKAVCVQWNPNASDSKAVIAAAVGREMLLICPRAPEKAPEGHILLAAGRTRVSRVASAASLAAAKPVVTWTVQESPGVDKAEGEESSEEEDEDDNVTAPIEKALSRGGEGVRARILHKSSVQYVAWHAKGDYVASVCPNAEGSAVTVHQVTRRASTGMFRRIKGQVQRVLFHPTKPIFFVATKTDVRVFHLVRKVQLKRLLSNVQYMSSLAIHPQGNHLVCGSFDGRLSWWDLDLATTPFKALHFHKKATRAVRFHKRYPLLASSSDDGTVHIFHAKVFSDLLTNPLIVPVKILRRSASSAAPVHDCVFHPTQPWIFAACDNKVVLFTNVDE